MVPKLLDQVIMNKGILTAIVQHCLSCYQIFAIPRFYLHWNYSHTDHLRSCFSCHTSTLQIVFEASKVAFQISFFIHCLIPICLGLLVWCISMKRSWMIPLIAGTDQSLSTCLCIVTFSHWFFRHPEQNLSFARNLILSFKVLSIKLLQPSSLCFSLQ